ncbi:hypothetical protein [Labilibaculum euxinus]
MDYQNDFETWKEKIEALPFSEVKLPNQPIDEITASAETLTKEAAKDKEQLAKAGLDVILIDELCSTKTDAGCWNLHYKNEHYLLSFPLFEHL